MARRVLVIELLRENDQRVLDPSLPRTSNRGLRFEVQTLLDLDLWWIRLRPLF